MRVEIHSAARRHGVADEDRIHALGRALAWVELGDDPPRCLLAGQDQTGNLLELVVLNLDRRARDPRHGAPGELTTPARGRLEMTGRVYGQTHSGEPVDDELVEKLAAESEQGYDDAALARKPRGRGRPPLGRSVKTVESVRLDPELRDGAAERAAADGVSVSEVIRRALREYLRST